MGCLLQGLGRRLTGKKVMRFWPDNGGWWEADVHTYNASTGQHRFMPCPTHCLPSMVIAKSSCSFDHDLAAEPIKLHAAYRHHVAGSVSLTISLHTHNDCSVCFSPPPPSLQFVLALSCT